LNAHRQIEIHLRKGMQKAHRLQKKRMIRQRLMVTPPDVDCADAKFSARVRAFAAAPQQIPIPLLTHRLAAPAGYSVPSLGAPTPCMSPGAVYRISNVLAGCVLKSNPSFGMAYVAHLHHVDCCRNVSHRGGCWRYAKQSQPAWVKIDTLGNDLISIAPRFAHKGDLKAPIHATCFRVVANPTPERHQNCQLLVHHVFETSGTTITAEEAHMLAGLVPVKRFWYAFQDGTDMDPAMLMCSACQNLCAGQAHSDAAHVVWAWLASFN
jgi:hypothetical protein